MFNFGNKENIDFKKTSKYLLNYIPKKPTYFVFVSVLVLVSFYLLVLVSSNKVYVFTPNAIASKATIFFDEIKDENDINYYKQPYFNLIISKSMLIEIGGGVTYIKGRFIYLTKDELSRTKIVDLSPDDMTFYSIDGYIPSKKSSVESFLVYVIRDKISYDLIVKDSKFKAYNIKYGGAIARNELGEFYYIDVNIIEDEYVLSPISKNYKLN